MFELRRYQQEALDRLGSAGEQVLSICPGGGKTYTALAYVQKHQFKRVLILAHGTNLLKNQWVDELKKEKIEYSTEINSKSSIIISIPQALKNKKIPKFDLVIVDEAHEFYFAEKMVKDVIQKANPKCILLLTGTPSKFIHRGLKPVIIPGVEVYSEGFLTDTYFGVVTSSYKTRLNQFNDDGDMKGTVKFSNEDTNESLDSLVKEMISRLKSVGLLKKSPSVLHSAKRLKLNLFQEAFGVLGKTLISAKDIRQADQIYKSLVKNKVNAVMSHSESDEESLEINRFLTDPDVQVLVVVRRGILGFNMPELVNVVDFTMSRNIDRIYQLYARVLRKHDKIKDKFFFRLCDAVNPAIDSYFLQAAMCLNNLDFISKFNGKNLNQMEVLMPKEKTNKLFRASKSSHKKGLKKNVHVDSIMADEILSLELLTDLIVNSNSPHWKEFGYAKFGKVIEKLTGKEFAKRFRKVDKENLRYMIETGKVDERIYE